MSRPKVIFPVDAFVKACDAAEAANLPLSSVIKLEWDRTRSGPNGTLYSGINAVVDGVVGPAVFRVTDEVHSGLIAPLSADECARITAERRLKEPLKPRDRAPCLQVQKYAAPVETEKDGVTIKKDETGKPILPADETRSLLFRAIEFIEKVFLEEGDERVESERVAVLNDRRDTTKKPYPPGVLFVSNTTLCSPIQRKISKLASKNAGETLPNPLCRIKIRGDEKKGTLSGKYYDKSKPFTNDEGKPSYESYLDKEGQPACLDNIHNIVVPRSRHTGIVDCSSICYSNLGISIVSEIKVDVIEDPADNSYSLDDVFGAAAPAPPPTKIAAKPAAPPVNSSDPASSSGAAPPPMKKDKEALDPADLEDLVSSLTG